MKRLKRNAKITKSKGPRKVKFICSACGAEEIGLNSERRWHHCGGEKVAPFPMYPDYIVSLVNKATSGFVKMYERERAEQFNKGK